MSNPWFRFYSEFSHDPKVQMMSEAMQRRYIMVMCLRCSNALVTLHETEIAFHLRVTDAELAETKALFISKGFIDDKWNLLNWEKRQFVSDSSAPRVAKHRQKIKEACNTDVTLQKQQSNALDTDTDTDNKKHTPDKRAAFNPKTYLLEAGVEQSVVDDWLTLRKSKRAAVTLTAIHGIEREAKLAKWTLHQALTACCERGWQGFKAEFVANLKPTPPPITTLSIEAIKAQRKAEADAAKARMREDEAKYIVPPVRLQA